MLNRFGLFVGMMMMMRQQGKEDEMALESIENPLLGAGQRGSKV